MVVPQIGTNWHVEMCPAGVADRKEKTALRTSRPNTAMADLMHIDFEASSTGRKMSEKKHSEYCGRPPEPPGEGKVELVPFVPGSGPYFGTDLGTGYRFTSPQTVAAFLSSYPNSPSFIAANPTPSESVTTTPTSGSDNSPRAGGGRSSPAPRKMKGKTEPQRNGVGYFQFRKDAKQRGVAEVIEKINRQFRMPRSEKRGGLIAASVKRTDDKSAGESIVAAMEAKVDKIEADGKKKTEEKPPPPPSIVTEAIPADFTYVETLLEPTSLALNGLICLALVWLLGLPILSLILRCLDRKSVV